MTQTEVGIEILKLLKNEKDALSASGLKEQLGLEEDDSAKITRAASDFTNQGLLTWVKGMCVYTGKVRNLYEITQEGIDYLESKSNGPVVDNHLQELQKRLANAMSKKPEAQIDNDVPQPAKTSFQIIIDGSWYGEFNKLEDAKNEADLLAKKLNEQVIIERIDYYPVGSIIPSVTTEFKAA